MDTTKLKTAPIRLIRYLGLRWAGFHFNQSPPIRYSKKKSSFIFFCLLLIVFAGCSKEKKREWEVDDVAATRVVFNGGRIILGPDSDSSNLELELMRSSSGIRLYLNLLLFQARPWNENPALSTLTIQFEGKDSWEVHPYLLQGGQRLMFPGDVADTLVQTLLDGSSFLIQIGRSQLNVIPDHFSEAYKTLLDIPIAARVQSS